MPFKEKESHNQYMRDYRNLRKPSASVNPSVNPVTPPEAPKIEPQDGVDGWHTDQAGRQYLRQSTGMGGLVRCYHPMPRMFNYHQEPHPDYVKSIGGQRVLLASFRAD